MCYGSALRATILNWPLRMFDVETTTSNRRRAVIRIVDVECET